VYIPKTIRRPTGPITTIRSALSTAIAVQEHYASNEGLAMMHMKYPGIPGNPREFRGFPGIHGCGGKFELEPRISAMGSFSLRGMSSLIPIEWALRPPCLLSLV